MKFITYSLARFIIGIISVSMCIGLIRSIVGQVTKRDVVYERKQGLLQEQERNRQLQLKLREATSSAYIEKIAREKLGFAKEGDTIVLFDKSQITNSNDQTGQLKAESNWDKWWKVFF